MSSKKPFKSRPIHPGADQFKKSGPYDSEQEISTEVLFEGDSLVLQSPKHRKIILSNPVQRVYTEMGLEERKKLENEYDRLIAQGFLDPIRSLPTEED